MDHLISQNMIIRLFPSDLWLSDLCLECMMLPGQVILLLMTLFPLTWGDELELSLTCQHLWFPRLGILLQWLQRKRALRLGSSVCRFKWWTLTESSVPTCEENSKYIVLCCGLNRYFHVFLDVSVFCVFYSFFNSWSDWYVTSADYIIFLSIQMLKC